MTWIYRNIWSRSDRRAAYERFAFCFTHGSNNNEIPCQSEHDDARLNAGLVRELRVGQ